MQLDDLDFVDGLALLSHTHQQMRKKTTSVAAVVLNINKGEIKILRYSIACTNRITLDEESLKNVKTFTYLGSIIDEQGGSDADVKAWIGEARAVCLQLRNIWNLKQLSTNTKVGIFNTNVKTVLLYGDETWRTITTIIKEAGLRRSNKLQGFRILVQSSYHPNKIDKCIEEFLLTVNKLLEDMSDEEFNVHVQSLMTHLLEKPKGMQDRFGRLWSEIACRHYNFKRSKFINF
ncbi:unnamed protein product [Schistosoma curassoni]|uniref:DUF6451 domain-containing protein n=1 Tax=Schistosoma curassoni TaxID=6186 RepID=A0A183KTI0_9TREM|nr:unnamed protein product [Schistosoma curassoni]